MQDIVTKENLTEVIIFHLTNLQAASASEQLPAPTGDTVLSAILSDTDGYGASNSKQVFKSFIIDTLVENGHQVKLWPADWIGLSVNDLVTKLF